MKNSDYINPLWIRSSEPRLDVIRRQLEALLQVVELEKNGEVVEVDGFRLKNLEDWLVPIRVDANSILSEVACPCDLTCEFCYLKGLPPGESAGQMRSFKDIATKIRYFSREKGKMLFQTTSHVEEQLRHPYIFEVLRLLRQKTNGAFELLTNGSVLTEAFIARLAEFMPLTVTISLNSSRPEIRGPLMRDHKATTAITSLPLMRQYGIPFRVSMVAWPTVSLEDMAETIYYADENLATLTRISLPGYTKYFPLKPEYTFDRVEYWTCVVEALLPLAQKTQTPLMFIPYLFVENLTRPGRKNEAIIAGTEPNSPAALAGLRPGDVVVEVNGEHVLSRPYAKDLISKVPKQDVLRLVIKRDTKFYRVTIDPELHGKRTSYPSVLNTKLRGIIMPMSLRLGCIEIIRDIIQKHKAKSVLLLTTELMLPTLLQALTDVPVMPADVDLYLEIPKQNFWGGNIIIGDLLVVEDYVDHILDFIKRYGARPDLVLIPGSGFTVNQAGGWKRDVQGVYYRNIERMTGVKVELIRSDIIYY